MADVAIISDTHVPSRESAIPDWVVERVREADHTIHAGDFDSPEAYETVADIAGPELTAVTGNMDPASLDLPEVATVEVGEATFVVTHGTAASLEEHEATIAEAIDEKLDGPGIAVAGHTHAIVDDEIAGTRFLNPGSATGADPAETPTMITVEVTGDETTVRTYVDGEQVEDPDEYPGT